MRVYGTVHGTCGYRVGRDMRAPDSGHSARNTVWGSKAGSRVGSWLGCPHCTPWVCLFLSQSPRSEAEGWVEGEQVSWRERSGARLGDNLWGAHTDPLPWPRDQRCTVPFWGHVLGMHKPPLSLPQVWIRCWAVVTQPGQPWDADTPKASGRLRGCN